MEKQTVISRVNVSIDFNKETFEWMDTLAKNSDKDDLWFTRDHGQTFLYEYQHIFGQILIEEIDLEVQSYFRKLGLSEELLPQAKITEIYTGSLIMTAIITVSSTITGTFVLLKGISEIPNIVEGINKLKTNIANKFRRKANSQTQNLLNDQAKRNDLPSPPQEIIDLKSFVIDARPLSALTPSQMQSHSLHLQVGISQNAFTLENLGNDMIRDIQIGLFIGESKRNQWKFAEAFASTLDILSSKQTISKKLSDFINAKNEKIKIDHLPVYIDCWVQDSHGIYLFNFYIDK